MSSIIAENVKLELPVGQRDLGSAPQHAFQAVGERMFTRGRRGLYVKALDGINLDLRDGDRLALVGHNGAGKSCLLRVLAQVYLPTAGRISVDGRVSSVLTTSLGFKTEATGYENIMLSGLLRGFTKEEVHEVIPDIEDFCELGYYLNLPIRTYSKGMKVRLGFAIATAVHPDILMIDEILGAGDAGFQKKARPRITAIMDHAQILAIASHSNSLIEEFCNKAVWLDHGQIRAYGPIEDVLADYTREPSKPR